MNTIELIELSRRESNLAAVDLYGSLMFKFYPNLNFMQRIIFEIFQVFLYIWIEILNQIYFGEHNSKLEKIWCIIKSPSNVVKFWRFDLILASISIIFILVLSIWRPICLISILFILWALRINAVTSERLSVIDEIDYQCKLHLEHGDLNWKWRYDSFESIKFSEMVFKFWKPVSSFYAGHGCIKHYEDLT